MLSVVIYFGTGFLACLFLLPSVRLFVCLFVGLFTDSIFTHAKEKASDARAKHSGVWGSVNSSVSSSSLVIVPCNQSWNKNTRKQRDVNRLLVCLSACCCQPTSIGAAIVVSVRCP